jgi:hypothetical protein
VLWICDADVQSVLQVYIVDVQNWVVLLILLLL